MTPRKMTTDVGVDEITLEDYFAAAALTGTLAAQTRKVPIDVVGRYANRNWRVDGGGVAPRACGKVETATCQADPGADSTAPPIVSDLDPVMVGEKDGHSAEARVCAIPDYGLTARWNAP